MSGTTLRRVMKELRDIQKNPIQEFTLHPVEDNALELHFTLMGPPDSPYKDGIYHGRILIPSEYPFAPPDVVMLTPSGRFEIGKKVCLSVSSYHPERWKATWGIATVIHALRDHMATSEKLGIGAVDYPNAIRVKMATQSFDFVCKECGVAVAKVWEDTMKNAPPATDVDVSAKKELLTSSANSTPQTSPQVPPPHSSLAATNHQPIVTSSNASFSGGASSPTTTENCNNNHTDGGNTTMGAMSPSGWEMLPPNSSGLLLRSEEEISTTTAGDNQDGLKVEEEGRDNNATSTTAAAARGGIGNATSSVTSSSVTEIAAKVEVGSDAPNKPASSSSSSSQPVHTTTANILPQTDLGSNQGGEAPSSLTSPATPPPPPTPASSSLVVNSFVVVHRPAPPLDVASEGNEEGYINANKNEATHTSDEDEPQEAATVIADVPDVAVEQPVVAAEAEEVVVVAPVAAGVVAAAGGRGGGVAGDNRHMRVERRGRRVEVHLSISMIDAWIYRLVAFVVVIVLKKALLDHFNETARLVELAWTAVVM